MKPLSCSFCFSLCYNDSVVFATILHSIIAYLHYLLLEKREHSTNPKPMVWSTLSHIRITRPKNTYVNGCLFSTLRSCVLPLTYVLFIFLRVFHM